MVSTGTAKGAAPWRWTVRALTGAAILLAAYEAASLVIQANGWASMRRPLYENARVYDRALFASNSPLLTSAPGCLWQPRANVRWRNVSTNSAGFRGPELLSGGATRIAILGDSMTFGTGLPDEGTWPLGLKDYFERVRDRVEVVNAGVPCQTIVQGLEWYRGRVRRLRPATVVVAYNRIEDATDSIDGVGDLEHVQRSKRLLSRIGSGLARLCVVRSIADAFRGDPSAARTAGRRPRVTAAEYRSSLTALLDEIRASRANALVVLGPRPGALGADPALLQEFDDITREVASRDGASLLNLPMDETWFVHDGRLSLTGAQTLGRLVGQRLTALQWTAPLRASGDGTEKRR